MRIHDRALVQSGLALVLSLAAATVSAQAQWPAKPMRMLIALAPGGGVDTTGRLIAQKLSERWGQPVVVENRPGAGGSLATETLARAAPDGYTMLTNSSGVAITPSLMKLSYDPRKDIVPVSLAVISPGVMVVHPSLPVRSVKEFIAFAKARPGDLLYSSSGNGTGQHLAAELFAQMAGVKMMHVPYKGTAPSITDLIGGRVSLSMASVVSTRQFFEAGKLRALAVLGAKRTPALPKLPTIAESGVAGYAYENWYGVFMPGRTPMDIVLKTQQEITRIVNDPEIESKLVSQGLDPVGSTHAEFVRFYEEEIVKNGKLIASIKMEAR
ncbi:MAG: tripartite tricarboxylate transporter substrate binding protein [bacterium]|jgi:tripartite-type tricarboxylate transporter receptor subunit TctC|nr:tripartite tricarboxylate transporter substrate binding protein [Betaproteobacteria bacterium]